MALTGPALRALCDGHRRAEAREARSRLTGIRLAVWAEAAEFTAALAEIDDVAGSGGRGDARARLAAELTARLKGTGRE